MPIHDWSRVPAGTFHDFHVSWIPKLKNILNRGILPKGYYAMAEQVAGSVSPDVITLEEDPKFAEEAESEGGIAVAARPPRVAISAVLEPRVYAEKTNHVVIRHTSRNRVVALLEVVSPGNKGSRRDFEAFLDKAFDSIQQGVHLLVIDLHAPTSRDPQGMHGAIWESLGDNSYVAPALKPLTIASYVGQPDFRAYVEPLAVKDALPVMPLFLTSTRYVEVPLEQSYMEAVDEIAERARAPLEQ